jgi:hypothetical protein
MLPIIPILRTPHLIFVFISIRGRIQVAQPVKWLSYVHRYIFNRNKSILATAPTSWPTSTVSTCGCSLGERGLDGRNETDYLAIG